MNQDNDLNDNKLKNIDSVTVKRNPASDNELVNKNILMMKKIKILFLGLIRLYKIISKYLLETIYIILLNMIKYKLQIQQKLNVQIQVAIVYRIGL